MRPGWYPDPTGAPAWRWFDGQRWTAVAVARDSNLPPTGIPPAGQPPGPLPPALDRPRGTGWLVLVLALILAAGVLLSLAPLQHKYRITLPPPGPAETSQAPEPSRPAATCQIGMAPDRSFHPGDDALYGGRLRLPAEKIPYSARSAPTTVLRALSDVASAQEPATTGRPAEFSLGEIRRTAAYPDPQVSARLLLDCLTRDPRLYDTPASLTITSQRPLPVSQRPGALLAGSLSPGQNSRTGLTTVAVLVVDDGRPDRWSVVFASTRQAGDHERVLAALAQVRIA